MISSSQSTGKNYFQSSSAETRESFASKSSANQKDRGAMATSPVGSEQSSLLQINNNELIDLLIASCDELCDFVSHLDSDLYVLKLNANSSIGAHVRHVLDRIVCLIEGIESGIVNYDNRERNPIVETCTVFCQERILKISESLSKLKSSSPEKLDTTLLVRETVCSNGKVVILESSLAREILDLLNHNIHHKAIMKILAEAKNINLNNDFGKAISTIIYEKNNVYRNHPQKK